MYVCLRLKMILITHTKIMFQSRLDVYGATPVRERMHARCVRMSDQRSMSCLCRVILFSIS